MKTYTVTVPAYGKQPGETVSVDPNDPLVALNLASGVLVAEKGADTEPAKKVCTLCLRDLGMKRPPKFTTTEEVWQHYEAKHPGFVPVYTLDTEEEVGNG